MERNGGEAWGAEGGTEGRVEGWSGKAEGGCCVGSSGAAGLGFSWKIQSVELLASSLEGRVRARVPAVRRTGLVPSFVLLS